MGSILMKRKRDRTEEEKDKERYEYGENEVRPNPQVKTSRRFQSPVTLYSDWHNE